MLIFCPNGSPNRCNGNIDDFIPAARRLNRKFKRVDSYSVYFTAFCSSLLATVDEDDDMMRCALFSVCCAIFLRLTRSNFLRSRLIPHRFGLGKKYPSFECSGMELNDL